MVRERSKIAKRVANRSLVAYLNPTHKISEQYRTIRNNIQYASDGRSIRSILVTSPSDGDGKSTAAINLAISMAQRGDQVLLIDANFRNPVLHKIFNAQISPGLSNVLTQQLTFAEATHATEVEGLELLTSGLSYTNSADMLDSQSMKEIIEMATKRYDRIVIDCPPVLNVPDTNALVNKCDGVVLLLNCGKTTHSKALEAKQSLTFAGAHIIGAILNKKNV
ncbi:CpsD/CapB family tyrosine-protein kinase [Paenibacillus sp. GSMTC-2017]|uniref:CpsD/CapB family tyrosine-protein kinase n=1 Tax=Paenibacillus sp. GSMTC-2017 TaxID=2794350 RepID=UPI0018D86EB8|nr:CpsD/CapB family tyrosine-protein kinase [Paenibacillus sp. GSMTC-2017]MBH5317311.1 CpsD/CapB family tyrosine-protein kinase [Paenibacillus sp. GSMTC-2017]